MNMQRGSPPATCPAVWQGAMRAAARAAGGRRRAAAEAGDPDEAPGRAPLRVLVVEDEMLTALYLEDLLQRLGHVVTGSATDAPGAVRAAGQQRPDLVLMDIRLAHGTDGIAAAQEIRTRFGIRAVFLTAHSDPSTRQNALLTDPLGFVTKPFSEAQIEAALERAAGQLPQP